MKYKAQYIFLAAALVLIAYFSYQIFASAGRLQVVFLDVGQGDSVLIQKGTRQILIDGGPNGKTELAKLGGHIPYSDREIELVIATHPDRDHIAGLIDVARNFKIGKVIATGAEKDTSAYKEWKNVLDFKKVETIEALRGDEIVFDEVKIKIVFPDGPVDPAAGDANNKSVVARLDFGASSFLFTGDIESPAEREILAGGENINVDVLKIAHHGSKYSSGEEFLDAVSPAEAVISVGANNSYGHPTEAVLEVLRQRNVKIFRTDESGDIVYNCSDQKCGR